MLIRCPSCETEDPEVVKIMDAVVRVRTPVQLDLYNRSISDGCEGDDEVTDILDRIDGSEKWECQSCYHQEEDLDEFAQEHDKHCDTCGDPIDDDGSELCSDCETRSEEEDAIGRRLLGQV